MNEQQTTSPNDRQVGGSHYRAGYQHWDLVIENRLPYLEGQITKYITRYKKKNGAQDVEKSIHYCEKLQSALAAGSLIYPGSREPKNLDLFAKDNNLDDIQVTCFLLAMTYTDADGLTRLRQLLDHLLSSSQQEQEETSVAEILAEAPIIDLPAESKLEVEEDTKPHFWGV